MKPIVLALFCAFAGEACGSPPGGPDAPEFLNVAALGGTYRVTLTRDASSPSPASSCRELEVTVGAQVTWRGVGCDVRAAGGARDLSAHSITLNQTFDLADGGGTMTQSAHLFGVFQGTAARLGSSWIGPCADGGASCPVGGRELGSAEWVRR